MEFPERVTDKKIIIKYFVIIKLSQFKVVSIVSLIFYLYKSIYKRQIIIKM